MPLIFAAFFHPINDITTSFDPVPQFIQALALPANAGKSLDYPEAFRELQLKLYPDLMPLKVERVATEVFAQAKHLAEGRPHWVVLPSTDSTLRFEAVVTSPLMHFADDVVLIVEPAGTGSIVNMRSRSRVGKSDLGVNYQRIRSFLADLQKWLSD